MRTSSHLPLHRIALAMAVLAIAVVVRYVGESGPIPQVPNKFMATPVATGLDLPISLDFLPDGRVIFIEMLYGKVRALVDGSIGAIDPLVVVDSIETLGGERGLTGIAVDPKWPIRPYIYVFYSALGRTLRISRYKVTGDLTTSTSPLLFIDPASRMDVLREIPDVHPVHNSGTLRFGPDGMLYAATGDDRADCAAQDTVSLRGVLLRLDVSRLPDGPGVADKSLLVPFDNPFAQNPNPNAKLVWATGLRNAFRFSIDPADGSIFVGDVGDISFEEVTHLTAPGQNGGWPFFEGLKALSYTCDPPPVGIFTDPIYSYDREGFTGDGRASVICGPVYHAVGDCPFCNFPEEYEGNLFFSDFWEGFVRRMVLDNGVWKLATPIQGQPNALDWARGFEGVTEFVVGPDGAIWYTRLTPDFETWIGVGEIGRITYEHAALDVGESGAHGVRFLAPRPSPAADHVWLSYTLSHDAGVALQIFDALGRSVRTLVQSERATAGAYSERWDGRDDRGVSVAAGIYLARLRVGSNDYVQRVPLVR